jgi:hypothetical protein
MSQGFSRITNSITNYIPRVQTLNNVSSLTPQINLFDTFNIKNLSQNITINNPIGDVADFQKFIIIIKDDGVQRSITWGSDYQDFGSLLPSSTVANKTLILGFAYLNNKYNIISKTIEN